MVFIAKNLFRVRTVGDSQPSSRARDDRVDFQPVGQITPLHGLVFCSFATSRTKSYILFVGWSFIFQMSSCETLKEIVREFHQKGNISKSTNMRQTWYVLSLPLSFPSKYLQEVGGIQDLNLVPHAVKTCTLLTELIPSFGKVFEKRSKRTVWPGNLTNQLIMLGKTSEKRTDWTGKPTSEIILLR